MRSVDRQRRLLTLGALFVSACGGGGGTGDPASGPTPSPPPGGSTPPLISGFTPTAGAPGMQVRIEGLGFVAGASGNTVRINGVDATVIAASTLTIDITVPPGATTSP
ncbi:MAG TPA: IPT/TIG domain-containing protein [Burkholderiaceae bacterium]